MTRANREEPRSGELVVPVLTQETAQLLPSNAGASYLVNPGAVGQPRDAEPRAKFAVVDTRNVGRQVSQGDHCALDPARADGPA